MRPRHSALHCRQVRNATISSAPDIYLAAIEADRADETFAFLASDVRQIEYPNQFVPKGAERDLEAMRGRRAGTLPALAHSAMR